MYALYGRYKKIKRDKAKGAITLKVFIFSNIGDEGLSGLKQAVNRRGLKLAYTGCRTGCHNR